MCFKKIKDIIGGLVYPDKTVDVISPQNRIPRGNITFRAADGILEVSGFLNSLWVTPVANTKSMDPVIDSIHIALLEEYPQYKDGFGFGDLCVGDIIGYEVYPKIILHRIIAINEYEGGRIYTCRGDNTAGQDPYAIGDVHVKWVLVGILY